jgi:hypothetical protein
MDTIQVLISATVLPNQASFVMLTIRFAPFSTNLLLNDGMMSS